RRLQDRPSQIGGKDGCGGGERSGRSKERNGFRSHGFAPIVGRRTMAEWSTRLQAEAIARRRDYTQMRYVFDHPGAIAKSQLPPFTTRSWPLLQPGHSLCRALARLKVAA